MQAVLSHKIVKIQKYIYPTAGHIITENLKIISNSRTRYIVSKGLKYRFPFRIDLIKYTENIASALNDFGKWISVIDGVNESMLTLMP